MSFSSLLPFQVIQHWVQIKCKELNFLSFIKLKNFGGSLLLSKQNYQEERLGANYLIFLSLSFFIGVKRWVLALDTKDFRMKKKKKRLENEIKTLYNFHNAWSKVRTQ